jgi:hypothetical protein
MPEEDALITFWQDPRHEGGFRLTFAGYQALKNINIDHYKFDVPQSTIVSPGALLTLNRKLTSPYFLNVGKNPCIVFFGSKEATMYSLYGDVNKFIHSLLQY